MDRIAFAIGVWIVTSVPLALIAGSAISAARNDEPRPRRRTNNVVDLTTMAHTDAIAPVASPYRDTACLTSPLPVSGTQLPNSQATESRSPAVHDV